MTIKTACHTSGGGFIRVLSLMNLRFEGVGLIVRKGGSCGGSPLVPYANEYETLCRLNLPLTLSSPPTPKTWPRPAQTNPGVAQ